MDHAGVIEDTLGDGRLSGINMRDNSDIACFFKRY
jgi:hypothetical protein